MTSVLIIDDHPIVLQGCRRMLEDAGIVRVLEARDATSGYRLYRRHHPDVVIVDLAMQGSGLGGLDVIRRMRSHDQRSRILVFSMHSETGYVLRALNLGARGYVSKSAPAAELLNAVKRAARGEPYVDSETARELASAALSPEESLKDLTPRETEILRLLGEGKSLSGIAETLGIAYKTVANTCSKLKEKLGLERTGDLIRLAVENRTHKLAPD